MVSIVRAAVIGIAALLFALPAAAEEKHGLSIFGNLKYAPDFRHFAYANPDAPKGGKVSQVGPGGDFYVRQFQ